ncbi:NAD(P)-dependent alcohol dehydrogenase [Kitasatospora sp. NPDC088346]|uniref:NAD(P)-dependent alcohol dehydrogenase n=1 Tax=Kitasatospora sp. NPDC088346 TaxID=3364073 RepID=UPI00380D428D
MKAIVHDVYGPPSVLRLDEVERPAPGPGEVLVRILGAGLDQGVWHLTAGMPYLVRTLGFGLRAPKVRIRGLDLAGRVEAVGRDVTRFQVGDEVYGTCDGSFAEYACTTEDRLALKPANLDFPRAAAVPVSACTALQGLRDAGRLREGQTVLVLGAGGGVGTYAVQLAKALGAARVTGVCSTAKTELVRSIGADEVIDHTREDPASGARRYDLVIDTGGNRPLRTLRRALTPRGTLVIVGGEGGGRWIGGFDRPMRAALLAPFTGHRFPLLAGKPRHQDLRVLAEHIEAGRVTPVVERCYPLAEVPQALAHLREGTVRGKLAVTVQAD